MTVTWVGDDGLTVPFDGSAGVHLSVDATEGLTTLPTDLIIDPRVNVDGGALISQRRSARRIILDLYVSGAVRATHAALLRSFARGGSLTYTAGAETRTLRRLVLESPDRSWSGEDLSQRDDDLVAVSLLALDPWWYGAAVEVEIDLDDPGTAWSDPIVWDADIPWNGGWAVALDIAGDAPVSPVWMIGGELDALVVASGSMSWTWDTPLPATNAGQIDTRPGNRGPRRGTDFEPGWDALDSFVTWSLIGESSRMFTLPAGESDLIVGPVGAETGSKLILRYEPRWLTP